MAQHTTPNDPARNDPSLRGGLSADYTEPDRAAAKTGATHERMPAKGTSWAKIGAGLLVAVVVGLLVTRMPFLAGSLNAGAPVDEVITGSVEADGGAGAVDTSSALPEPDELTPSTLPATQ